MLRRDELNGYLDELLETARFDDYAPNGLQVEGAEHISTLVTGVTASRALVDAALQTGAEALLVHHGYFWRGEDPRIIGMKRARLAPLLAHDINLFAYHLPLDAHADYGNNVQLARVLDLSVLGRFGPPPQLGLYGVTSTPFTLDEFASHIERRLARAPLAIAGGAQLVQNVGWCTGAAEKLLAPAAAAGLDAFITGEISEHSVHAARELGIHLFAAGHHATERYGVAALGDHLAQHFGIAHVHIEIPNPV